MNAEINAFIPATTISKTGPGPSQERFDEAILYMQRHQISITRRAVQTITGGTTAVVNKLCQAYEAKQIENLKAYALPTEFDAYIKRLVIAEREKAAQAALKLLAESQANLSDLEAQFQELERRVAIVEGERDQERAGRMAAEQRLEEAKQAQRPLQDDLQESRLATEEWQLEATKLGGELRGVLEGANAREHDHRQQLQRFDRLVDLVLRVATDGSELKTELLEIRDHRQAGATARTATARERPLPPAAIHHGAVHPVLDVEGGDLLDAVLFRPEGAHASDVDDDDIPF